MNKKYLRMAEEILEVAEDLIFADSDDYIYDPEHKKHPSGGYHKTEKGWSKVEEKKNKSISSPKVEMTDEEYDNILWEKHETSKNPNTSPELLKKLSGDKSWAIRNDVASNPSTPTNVLDKLANDENKAVRINTAYNKNTSQKTLDKLSNDENDNVRRSVAKNSNTSPKTLDKLSNDENMLVRGAVAENPSTSIETLEKISKADKVDDGGPGHLARFNLNKRKKERNQKQWQNSGFDLSKLSPELREKVEDWDVEDIVKFIGWLKEHKG